MSGRRNLSKVFFGRFKQTAVETQYLNLEKSRFPLDLKCRFSEKRNLKLPSNLKIIINITTTTTTTIIIIIIILLIKWSSPSFLRSRWKSFFHHLIPARNYSIDAIPSMMQWHGRIIQLGLHTGYGKKTAPSFRRIETSQLCNETLAFLKLIFITFRVILKIIHFLNNSLN